MQARLWVVIAVGVGALLPPRGPAPATALPDPATVDAAFASQWSTAGLVPAKPAEPALVLRRLTLALCGTGPSLEELRAFETDASGQRLEHALQRLLEDPRFHRYFAERLARVFVGTRQGAFLVYRRDRLVDWLTEQFAANRPWDAVVRELIAAHGLWTGEPATNFVTSAVVENKVDSEQLAGRTMRAVLGERMDCAQCHDHPFAASTQKQFQGLAAFYEGLEISGLGVTQKPSSGIPAVPYGGDWLPASGAPRARLGGWLTDPRNRRFSRATANRIWGLVTGRPLVLPVDDLPEPPPSETAPLDVLARDFVEHGHDLRRLIALVALSAPMRLSSELPAGVDRAALEARQAVFPLTMLRAEQWVGALLQATSVRTIDLDSHLVVRLARFLRERAFVEEYGEATDDELAPHAATVPQALLRMNGKLPREMVEAQPFGAVGRILLVAPNDEAALETLCLAFVSRRPTASERSALLPLLAGTKGAERAKAGEDLAWALLNTEEFAWNH